ncbi:DUF2269 domain-containing protein [Micromonospora coxensis]|uniref:DUF2269 domain-containing protein n=1 Tax=Micromonospora coxensis TaxID=356852 RepID=UPI003427EAEE
MPPQLRKLALTAHVSTSVGWLGAVAAFGALALTGLTSRNAQLVNAAYPAMELVGWYVIVPLNLAALLTGLIQALGTQWGLVRHYWVLIKLVMTVLATVLLLVHMQPVGHMADAAVAGTAAGADLRPLRVQLLFDAGAAAVVLLVATTLSIYKPRGMTRYGQRKQRSVAPR